MTRNGNDFYVARVLLGTTRDMVGYNDKEPATAHQEKRLLISPASLTVWVLSARKRFCLAIVSFALCACRLPLLRRNRAP